MSARRGPEWPVRNEINDELDIEKLLFKTLVQFGSYHGHKNATKSDQNAKVPKMSLASGILFMVWVSIVFFAIGGWVLMTITKQEKSIYDDWDMDDDKDFHDGVGQRNILGKVKDIIAKDTLYLIVVKEVWDKIVLGDKRIEYRERTDYWDKRILNKQYKYMRITNGYGNDTRPYRLYQYTGATRVMKDGVQCFAISIAPDLVIESRDYMESSICHYSHLPSTSSYA